MLSIGAATLTEPQETFYIELQPDRTASSTKPWRSAASSMQDLADEMAPHRRER